MQELKEKMAAINECAADPLRDVRLIDEMKVGEHARQGDIYIVKVNAPVEGAVVESRQLADGTTMGSRHTVDESVTVVRAANFGTVNRIGTGGNVTGYGIRAKDRFTVDHPEHAPCSLPPGDYQVLHQFDPRTMGKVRD